MKKTKPKKKRLIRKSTVRKIFGEDKKKKPSPFQDIFDAFEKGMSKNPKQKTFVIDEATQKVQERKAQERFAKSLETPIAVPRFSLGDIKEIIQHLMNETLKGIKHCTKKGIPPEQFLKAFQEKMNKSMFKKPKRPKK